MTYIIVIALLLLSALFSGMNLGLMSLDPYELERKINLGDRNAAKIYPVRRRGNLLLVTLLLANVAVIAALSLFLDSIAHGLIAGIATTLLITVFGEIIPQALFSRHALRLGARLAWLIQLFMWLLWPICAPLAWALDKTLGDELPTIYSKKELMQIIEEHSHSQHSDVDDDEERIVRGALTFGEKRVHDVMTPRSVVVAVESSTKLDKKQLDLLRAAGHSRFPVYHETVDNMIGTLYWRDLVGADTSKKTAGELCNKKVYYLNDQDKLDDALNAFLKTKRHLFVVTNEFEEVQGVASIEDILEEIIDEEIVDEFDRYEDMREVARKRSDKREAA
jgi:metal transporter CNNM